MKFLELVTARKSVREYSTQEVETEKLDYILECARLAPSAVNFQPWSFIVIKSDAQKEKLKQCYRREWFSTPPVFVIACGNTTESWKRKYDGKDFWDVDVAIAVQHICLAATEQGLGSCWVCNFDVDLCKQLFELPEDIIPLAIIPLGYPAKEENRVLMRKTMEDIVINE